MTYYLQTDSDSRVVSVATVKQDGFEPCDCPEGFHDWDIYDYKVQDGALVKYPIVREEPFDMGDLIEMAADHEYRICLMELGVSEDDL